MSLYQFFASDYDLHEVENSYIEFMSINEAIRRGLHVEDFILNSDIDRDDKQVIMYCDDEEHLHEITLHKEILPGYANNYTSKKYCSILSWRYNVRRAEQLIEYIKAHLMKSENIELWNTWMDEVKKPNITLCKIDKLTIEEIKNIWGNHRYVRPECLLIEK